MTKRQAEGLYQQAARLFGATETLRDAIAAHIQAADLPDYERNVAHANTQPDDETFATYWKEGRTMMLEAAIAVALEQ